MLNQCSEVIEFDLEANSVKSIPLSSCRFDLDKTHKLYWVHCDLTQVDDLNHFAKQPWLPESLLELCRHRDMRTQMIDESDSLTLQIPCLLDPEQSRPRMIRFDYLLIHLTHQICFTASASPMPALLAFKKSYTKSLTYAKTPCFILFLILDDVINDYSRVLLTFETTADHLDIKIRETHDVNFNEVMASKKQVMKLKRHVASIRDILMRISGHKFTVISNACRLSLTNLFTHCQTIINEADAIRDFMKEMLDQIDNTLMQKMNNTMKVLTGFAAIFLPLTLIAGIYGMNFQFMPELTWRYGYYYALMLMAVCAMILLFIFKKIKWF